MTDYRQLMLLVLEQRPYREIVARQGCSQRTIAKVRRVLDEQQIDNASLVEALTSDEIDALFTDGRKHVSGEFVPVDIDRVVAARVGRSKPPLKVLWAQYLETGAPPGIRHYGYERFCQIVAEHVRTHDLTAPIAHVPGHTMQVDWAGTQMEIIDPITRAATSVSVFVASLPYSGLVFARGYLDQKQAAWLDAHRRAFEYVAGVPLLVIPDNASTASNQISTSSRARDVNASYAEFLQYYQTAAVPTRAAAPRDKGHVEAGVKVVTHWVIQYLAGRVFASLDDLNDAIAAAVRARGVDCPSVSHIVPWIIGSSADAIACAQRLRTSGFYVLPVRPPTVPEGTSRIRFSLTAALEPAEVDALSAAIRELGLFPLGLERVFC